MQKQFSEWETEPLRDTQMSRRALSQLLLISRLLCSMKGEIKSAGTNQTCLEEGVKKSVASRQWIGQFFDFSLGELA